MATRKPAATATAAAPPQVFAYLRVSTDAQDVDNQKVGVLEYCQQKGWTPATFEDTASGKTDWRKRQIGEMLETIPPGSILVASEVSRLARSTLQVLEIMRHAAERQISIHVIKSHLVLDGSMSSKITVTVLALAAEIEREFISARTREALARRKASGKSLGRPEGPAEVLKLDEKAAEIDKYLALGLSKRAIIKLVGCGHNTLYEWLNRRRPEWREKAKISPKARAKNSGAAGR
jgi:DNA invertase Pin-like site-specific DNA recombinase